jgi:hypothetical protein
MLGLAAPIPYGPFLVVQTANDVSLAFAQADLPITSQHHAFLVSEDEFDQIFERIQERALSYWAGPHHRGPGQINTRDGGRGVYFDDADGHVLEILTRPYGSGG